MDNLDKKIEKLNKLPKGYISTKKIHGKNYHYLQYLEDSVLKSEYIKESCLNMVKEDLKIRYEIENEIKEYQSSFKDLPKLSKRSEELTGSLMMADIPVANFEKGELTFIDEKRCPLFILRTHNLKEFLRLRAIDQTRTNSRLLKKALNIKESDDSKLVLYAYGQTITDNYWFKVKGSKLKYQDISFTGDFYSDLALKGKLIVYPNKPKLTPSITTRGSFEKCWKLENLEWWLYKVGSQNEIFSEVFVSKLAQKLNLNTAFYEHVDGYIRTKNFSKDYNFEPMVSIASDNDDYDYVFNKLFKLNERFAKDYLKLIFFDSLVNNVDRHNENCGLLRDRQTGEIISLAPNFDNNLALISRNEILNLNIKNDGFIKVFKDFLKHNEKAMMMYQELQIPKLTSKMIQEAYVETNMNINVDYQILEKYLLERYSTLINIK